MIRRVALVLILTLFGLAGIGLGSIVAAEMHPPSALLAYPDRQERLLPDGISVTLESAAELRVAHAQLNLSRGARFALSRHHVSPINGWQTTVELFEGQLNGRLQPKRATYRLTLKAQGGSVELTDESAFVAYSLPNGDLLFGVIEGRARLLSKHAEVQTLSERQGARLAADGQPTRMDWAVMRATAYRMDGAPLALPLELTDSQGITFTFKTGQLIGVPAETYRMVVQTLIPYAVEGLRLTAEQPTALAFTFGEIVFRDIGQGVTTTLSNEITLRLAGSESAWKVPLSEPLIAAPGRWSLFVQYANEPERRLEANILVGRRTELTIR
ncbi:MAG: hypothetical protein SNJ58_04035 [Aggregatilineales bacterium]